MNSAIDAGIDKVILSLVLNPDYYTEHGSKKIKRDDEEQLGFFSYLLDGLNDSKKFKKGKYKKIGSISFFILFLVLFIWKRKNELF